MTEGHFNANFLNQRILAAVQLVAARHAILTPFEKADSLVDGGMTSVAMVDLMLAIEGEFDLTIPDSELTAANFTSIDSLEALLTRLCVRESLFDNVGPVFLAP